VVEDARDRVDDRKDGELGESAVDGGSQDRELAEEYVVLATGPVLRPYVPPPFAVGGDVYQLMNAVLTADSWAGRRLLPSGSRTGWPAPASSSSPASRTSTTARPRLVDGRVIDVHRHLVHRVPTGLLVGLAAGP
jgi:hypothetical protein